MADKTKIIIRAATPYDLFALELMLAKGIEESAGLLPDYDQMHFFHTAINMCAAGLVFVAAERDDVAKHEKLVGCLNLDGKTWAWNKTVTILESVHFYVLPEARGRTLEDGKTAVWEGLLQAGQALADAAGVPMVINVIHQVGAENRAGAKDELFKRAGLQYMGGNHLYLPKPKAAEKAA